MAKGTKELKRRIVSAIALAAIVLGATWVGGLPFRLIAALMALLIVAGIGCCVAMSMPQVHIVAYCGDLGYGAARGAEMLSLMLGFGIVSRLASGVICDRIGGLRGGVRAGGGPRADLHVAAWRPRGGSRGDDRGRNAANAAAPAGLCQPPSRAPWTLSGTSSVWNAAVWMSRRCGIGMPPSRLLNVIPDRVSGIVTRSHATQMAPARIPRRSGVATGLGRFRNLRSFERSFVSLK